MPDDAYSNMCSLSGSDCYSGSLGSQKAEGTQASFAMDDSPDATIKTSIRPSKAKQKAKGSRKLELSSADPDFTPEETCNKMGRPKKPMRQKTGRPLSFTGDLDSPHLTEETRRKIKRQISNRESARRVRDRRIEFTMQLQEQVDALRKQQVQLQDVVKRVEEQRARLMVQKELMERQERRSLAEGQKMQQEAEMLRQVLQKATPASSTWAVSRQRSVSATEQVPTVSQAAPPAVTTPSSPFSAVTTLSSPFSAVAQGSSMRKEMSQQVCLEGAEMDSLPHGLSFVKLERLVSAEVLFGNPTAEAPIPGQSSLSCSYQAETMSPLPSQHLGRLSSSYFDAELFQAEEV